MDSRIVDAHLNLGVNYAQQGANDKAISAFKRVLELDDQNAVAAYNLALAHAKLRQWKEAAQGFRTAALLSPEDAQPQLDLGRVYLLQGDLAEAQRVLQTLVAKRPELAEGHALLSRVYESKGIKAKPRKSHKRRIVWQRVDLSTKKSSSHWTSEEYSGRLLSRTVHQLLWSHSPGYSVS